MRTIAPRLFAIDYRLPDYYDSRLTDSAPYRQKMDAVQDIRPAAPLYLDAAAFDCAVALFAHADIWENDPAWITTTGPIQNSLAHDLEQLPADDLLAVANYLMDFDRWEWQVDAGQFVRSAHPTERLNARTVERLVGSHLRLLVEKYIEQVRPFLTPSGNVFTNVPNWTVELLTRLFDAVRQVPALAAADVDRLTHALTQLQDHPQVPRQPCIVTIQHDEQSFTLVYTDYKIELSNHESVDSGAGHDHFQTFIFRYQRDGDSESQGDADEFEHTFIQALRSSARISVSTEE